MRNRLIIVCIIIGIILAWDGMQGGKIQQAFNSKKVSLKQEFSAKSIGVKPEEAYKEEKEAEYPELRYNYAINNKRIRCINDSNIFERYKCEVNASYDWEREINKSLTYLKKRMPNENYEKLIKNQKLWKRYEENTEKLVYSFIISKEGNYNQQIGYNYLANLKRQRNELLRTVYNFYSTKEAGIRERIEEDANSGENEQINKYLTYLQARTTKDKFILVSENQEIWENLIESDKMLVEEFIQGGIVSELSGEDEINKLYKNRAGLLRNVYNQYYKTIRKK